MSDDSKAIRFVSAVKDNYGVLSAAIVVVAVAFSTIFLFAYLRIFDWRLIWFVEYTDILTFGLIAVALISSFAAILIGATSMLWRGMNLKGRERIGYFAFMALMAVAVVGLITYKAEGTSVWFGFLPVMLIVSTIALMLIILREIKSGVWPSSARCAYIVTLSIIITGAFGTYMGLSVLDDTRFEHDVAFKNGDLNQAKLVIVMSRHTVLLKDNTIYVVPTADISQFNSRRLR